MQGKDPYESAETQQRLLAELRRFEELVERLASDRTALDALWKEMNAKAEEKDPRFKTAISVARDELNQCFHEDCVAFQKTHLDHSDNCFEALFISSICHIASRVPNESTSNVSNRCYPMKNRLPDVLPFDASRVELPTTKDDYINASRVRDLSRHAPSFIATQAPAPNTFTDFWTMVWQEQVGEKLTKWFAANAIKPKRY